MTAAQEYDFVHQTGDFWMMEEKTYKWPKFRVMISFTNYVLETKKVILNLKVSFK